MGISMSEYRQLMKNLGKDIDVPTIIIGISDAITEFSDATLATLPNILI